MEGSLPVIFSTVYLSVILKVAFLCISKHLYNSFIDSRLTYRSQLWRSLPEDIESAAASNQVHFE